MIDLAVAVDGYNNFSSEVVEFVEACVSTETPEETTLQHFRICALPSKTKSANATSAVEAQTARKFLLLRLLLGRVSGVKKI